MNLINRLDIIDNIVEYVYDYTDYNINKYMLNVLVAGSHNSGGTLIYSEVTQPGYYLVKLSLTDSGGHEIVNYLIMHAVYDVSTYSNGYWQDNKVWIDFTIWLDHPLIPQSITNIYKNYLI